MGAVHGTSSRGQAGAREGTGVRVDAASRAQAIADRGARSDEAAPPETATDPETAAAPESTTLTRRERRDAKRSHKEPGIGVFGAMLVVVLTPVVVAALGIAMLSAIGALTGWSPPVLKQTTSIDSLYTGDGFTKPRVVMIAVGLTVGYVAAAAMRWGIHRHDRGSGSGPMTRTPA